MAQVSLDIAGQRYDVACRDGGEEHLLGLGRIIDAKAREAERAVGRMSESRQLLLAALLLADEMNDLRAGKEPAPLAADPTTLRMLEELAARIEKLAGKLESDAG